MSSVQGHHAQVELDSVLITSKTATFDLIESKSNHLESLSIYTSLFSPLIRMTLVLVDFYDLIKGMKLIGNEEVLVKFKYAEQEKFTEITFRINSILDGIRRTDQRSGQLIVDCVSYDYYGFYTRVSKRLNGTSDSIINGLLTDVVGTDNDTFFAPSENELDLQTNYKSVLDSINLVCKHDNKFFYQDLDGYYTNSLDSLLSKPVKGRLYFLVNQKNWVFSDVVKSYKFDYWNNEILLDKNVIHPHYINLDGTEYKVNETDKSFSDIGDSNYFEDLEELLYTSNVYGNLDSKMDRQIASYNLNTNTISIKLNGYENRRIGDKLVLDYRGRDEIDVDHPLYSGEWLITEIRNELAVSDYVQTIKLAKIKYKSL